jgi:hypothetical protein
MSVERSRIALLAGTAALLLTSGVRSPAWAERHAEVMVYKSPT